MSPEAVTIRLKRVSQLRRLCLELGKMKPVASREDPLPDSISERTIVATQKAHDQNDPESIPS